jgi:hypothetical protein
MRTGTGVQAVFEPCKAAGAGTASDFATALVLAERLQVT